MTGFFFWTLLVAHTALLLYVLYVLLAAFRNFPKGNRITKEKLVCIILLMVLAAWIAFWWYKKAELIPGKLNIPMTVNAVAE